MVARALARTCTIATRYSVIRRQGLPHNKLVLHGLAHTCPLETLSFSVSQAESLYWNLQKRTLLEKDNLSAKDTPITSEERIISLQRTLLTSEERTTSIQRTGHPQSVLYSEVPLYFILNRGNL